ncbi:MAG: glycosyltransferase family 4 protein [Cyclobacteriaceae bacterium]|nr:glycosyltransferase family 4 protein [Cyclobacteriaceae bacterium]UYN87051.1 MAG: glycosyltransferase family 4 protein [Cyclobacteriaceae bacterium]
MKILVLHQFFNLPTVGGALRSYYLAHALVEKGIEVVVITTHNETSIREITSEGIEIHYLPVDYNNRYGFFKRVYSFWLFVWHIVKYAGKFREADVVYAISTPLTTGLAALWIKLRYKIPYYFEVGDLWPEAPVQMGFIKNPVLKAILYKLEKLIYKKSIAVVALSQPIQEAIEKTTPGKKVYQVPNMADTHFYLPEIRKPEVEQRFGVQNKFVVSYVGTLGLANGLEYMVHCAERVQAENLNIYFLICGDGKMYDDLQQLIDQKKLTNISLTGFLNREAVRDVLNVTDAVMVCYKHLPVLETGSPNKYFDALAAGKLIVINFGGWIKDELSQHSCGIAVDPKNPDDLIRQIKLLLADPVRLKGYQQNARKLAEQTYSRKKVGDRFARIFLNHIGT